MRPRYRVSALVGAIALYAVAFFLPAADPYFGPDSGYRPWPGRRAFLLGWHLFTHLPEYGPFVGLQIVAVSGWMANPAVWLALGSACFRRWWWVRLFGGVGVGLALSVLAVPKFADALAGQPGYWAWTASAVGLFVVGWWGRRSQVWPAPKQPSLQFSTFRL
jgi:hypothetical protein